MWLECLTANAKVATVLGSIPASSETWHLMGSADEACDETSSLNAQKSPFKKIDRLTLTLLANYIYMYKVTFLKLTMQAQPHKSMVFLY
jgi:hypothetical protein